MKKTLLFIAIFCSNLLLAQSSFDTIIDKGFYQSYFNTRLKLPVAVVYTLYQGGGEASRKSDNFINDTKIPMLTNKDYAGSGYDKGHLVPAEDFAYDDSLQNMTFRFYNCIPQTPALNRGSWKSLETQVRKISRVDTLCVINLMVYDSLKTKKFFVPRICYKAVYNVGTNRLMWIVGYTNVLQVEEAVVPEKIIFICDLLYELNRRKKQ